MLYAPPSAFFFYVGFSKILGNSRPHFFPCRVLPERSGDGIFARSRPARTCCPSVRLRGWEPRRGVGRRLQSTDSGCLTMGDLHGASHSRDHRRMSGEMFQAVYADNNYKTGATGHREREIAGRSLIQFRRCIGLLEDIRMHHARRSLSTVGGHTVANQPPTTVLLSFTFILSPQTPRNGVRSHSRCGTES